MRRLIITLSLALGLVAPLVLAAAVGARPFMPPGDGTVEIDAPCPSSVSTATVVPSGVYRAMVNELREQGYSRAQIQAEIGDALVVPASGARLTDAERCTRK